MLELRKMKNSHFYFFIFLFFEIFLDFFQKGLASNAQTNPDIEKHQLPGNGAKNLLGEILKLYNL